MLVGLSQQPPVRYETSHRQPGSGVPGYLKGYNGKLADGRRLVV